MRLTGIHIKSFRAIRDVTIGSVETALILVGQNNTGKSTILDALRAALGDYKVTEKDTGPEDVKAHMEEIRTYMRGHNLFDCFYGRFKKQENELLSRYVELAPREDFADILDAIDRFVYFESRRR